MNEQMKLKSNNSKEDLGRQQNQSYKHKYNEVWRLVKKENYIWTSRWKSKKYMTNALSTIWKYYSESSSIGL